MVHWPFKMSDDAFQISNTIVAKPFEALNENDATRSAAIEKIRTLMLTRSDISTKHHF